MTDGQGPPRGLREGTSSTLTLPNYPEWGCTARWARRGNHVSRGTRERAADFARRQLEQSSHDDSGPDCVASPACPGPAAGVATPRILRRARVAFVVGAASGGPAVCAALLRPPRTTHGRAADSSHSHTTALPLVRHRPPKHSARDLRFTAALAARDGHCAYRNPILPQPRMRPHPHWAHALAYSTPASAPPPWSRSGGAQSPPGPVAESPLAS